MEQDLKNDLESKKLQLEQLQEQVISVKHLTAEESARQRPGARAQEGEKNIRSGLGEIREMV